MLPLGVEGMRWEMLAFLFTIGSRQFGNDIQKMDIQELVTKMCKEKEEEKGNQAILLLFTWGSSILIHL